MQAAGMLRGTGANAASVYVFLLGTLLLAYAGNNAHALPLQVLPNIPGFIPVFIRHGDQPLEEINPALADAFREKQSLENYPSERLDHTSGNSDKIPENHPSFDAEEDDGGLNAGSRSKDTIYLIGVRQSNGEKDVAAPKIALPFEILEREAVESAASDDDHDRTNAEDVRVEKNEKNNGHKPIGLSTEAVIKAGGLPVVVKDLEKLAAEVEKQETKPNDLYDSSNANDRDESARRLETHVDKVSARRQLRKKPTSIAEAKASNSGVNDRNENTRPRPAEDPKEFRSGRLIASEPMLRPAIDPKESRPDDSATDFMESEE